MEYDKDCVIIYIQHFTTSIYYFVTRKDYIMNKFFSYRWTLLLGAVILGGTIYLANPKSKDPQGVDPVTNQFTINYDSLIDKEDAISKEKESDLPANLPKSTILEHGTLDVRNTHFSLNDNIDEVVEKLGIPGKIIDTEYDFKYYIYNNNYKKLLFIAVKENRLVGYYTDSIDFDLGGISSGSSLDEVNQVLGSNYTMEEVITHHIDSYTLHILMDQAGSGLVTGIYLLDNQVSLDEYSEDVNKNVELLVYDLTNSIRARHHIPILSWSSSASNSARKHSTDMAIRRYFDHIDPDGKTPGDRLREEGVYFTSVGENIIAGYGTAIFSTHGWFNSQAHREVILNENYRYLGVGFRYYPSSTYETYITQIFYR